MSRSKTPPRSLTTLEATAHHETGHAVISFALRLPVRYVTIEPDAAQRSLGHMMPFRVSEERSYSFRQDAHERRIMCCLAGPLAEERYVGEYNQFGAQSDEAEAADHAITFCSDSDEATAYLKWLSIRTKNLLDIHWPAVQAVATRLLDSKRISGVEARRLWIGALPEMVRQRYLSKRERREWTQAKWGSLP